MRERRDARRILLSAIEGSSPDSAMTRHVDVEGDNMVICGTLVPLSSSQVYVVGAGKASAHMARALEEVLGDRICSGIVNTKYGYSCKTRRIRINECGHPLPDGNTFVGTEEIISFLEARKRGDLVLALVSGGGSSLLAMPEEGVTLADKVETARLLLTSGASIGEINCVRKHLSSVKGGKLASHTKARVVCLLMSDVAGDDPSTIASGPFAPDRTTFADALGVLRKYEIEKRVPASVLSHLHAGLRGKRTETKRKTGIPHFIIANNNTALGAAQKKALALGYNPLILSSFIEGESREVARFHVQMARQILATGEPVRPPACLISGGETTVRVTGKGRGGPNCEFVLAAAMEGANLPVTIAALDTDGEDFTDAAGAIADGKTVDDGEEARKCLERNDSYAYLEKKRALIRTGPTGTNLNDVRIVLVGKD